MFPHKMELMEQEDIAKEVAKMEKKKGYDGVTSKDLEAMIVEKDLDITKVISETNPSETKTKIGGQNKSDFKRELNILINKCDFILEVVDARDPFSYRSKELEHNVTSHKDKRLIILLNKVDLVSK